MALIELNIYYFFLPWDFWLAVHFKCGNIRSMIEYVLIPTIVNIKGIVFPLLPWQLIIFVTGTKKNECEIKKNS